MYVTDMYYRKCIHESISRTRLSFDFKECTVFQITSVQKWLLYK